MPIVPEKGNFFRSFKTTLNPSKYIVLDFKKVRLVGQGFVDEVFRVFANKYPTISISYINANEDITFMIERGRNRTP